MKRKKRKGAAVVISVYNEKGGCAKTTTCLAVTQQLASRGYAVLLIDNDPQLNSSSSTLDYSQPGTGAVGINEVMLQGRPIQEAITMSKFRDLPLAVCPFTPKDVMFDESLISIKDFPQRESTLKQALEPVINDYDFIFIDCPGNFNSYSKNALAVSDYFIVPVEADNSNLEGLSTLMQHADMVRKGYNSKLDMLGVLMVKDRGIRINNEYREAFSATLGDKFFKTSIRHSKDVPESTALQMPVTLYEKRGNPATDYKTLTKEILKRVK